MIYTAPISEITWDDVDGFCQRQRPEDAYLDYKEDFPDRLQNTIAAMANTMGGVILIGVQEEKDSKPKVPIAGIAFDRGLSERVTNIIADNIMPPVFPEIQVCPNASGDRAVVMVRIHQSEQAPHAVAKNTSVYVRTGNRNKPEDLTDIDNLEWLTNRRQKSVALRETLYDRAKDRAGSSFRNYQLDYSKKEGKLGYANGGWLSIALSPLYPVRPFRDPPGMKALRREIEVEYHGGIISHFPYPQHKGGMLAHESLVIEEGDHQNFCYTELNVFGLYFYRQSLLRNMDSQGTYKLMLSEEIFHRLNQFIGSAAKFYTLIGYRGPLSFRIELDDLENCGLSKGASSFGHYPLFCRDPSVRLCDNFLTASLETERLELLIRSSQRIAWCFGWDIERARLEKDFTEHIPH